MIYTGIGSRKTPNNVLTQMGLYGHVLAKLGFTLRSGGANGADSAFEDGCLRGSGEMEIYLPWKGFNNNPSPLYHIPPEAVEYASEVYGSSFEYLTQPVKLLMSRNIQQVLGKNLDTPTDFVVCWTPGGELVGGTSQAIKCAQQLSIPVFNLGTPDGEHHLLELLEGYTKNVEDE